MGRSQSVQLLIKILSLKDYAFLIENQQNETDPLPSFFCSAV